MELGLQPTWKHPCHRHFNAITNSIDNFILCQNCLRRDHVRKGQKEQNFWQSNCNDSSVVG